ncbi:hypothetical protein ACFS5N_10565 [Mucilaginibacter ximonensis]|uniref:Tetratricopeptide repeat protein n=1 Tax=Mucilaginibacter ximonensis TaxID=538021 RepID=A0ABW5YDN1_9SPHI
MKKKVILIFLLLLYCNWSRASDHVSADSILTILRQKDSNQHKRLVLSVRYYFTGRPAGNLNFAKHQIDSLLSRYPTTDVEAVKLLVETMYLMELKKYIAAEKILVKSINLASQADDQYLLYTCFTQLAFIQTLQGKTTEAINSFRLARHEAIQLNDPYLQVLIDINISDIYYQNKLHSQSLHFLDEAQRLLTDERLHEPNFVMMIRVNKAENYFQMRQVDSLAEYSRQLCAMRFKSDRLYTYQQRSLYTLQLLRGQYKQALLYLAGLKKDKRYYYDVADKKNQADAFYHAGQLDSARAIGRQLIADTFQRNHPEVTLSIYEMLARIAMIKQEKDLAVQRFDAALQMAKHQLVRLAEVDTIATRLKLDDLESGYLLREEGFKRERLWLIFSVVTIGLILIAGAILYRSIRQKRHIERLLFETQKNELSYLNSHHLRRHVANILGIVDTIKHAENHYTTYVEAEPYLLCAATDLDQSIREITAKLDDQPGGPA